MQAYTVDQVAEILHIGRDKVYQLLRTQQATRMTSPVTRHQTARRDLRAQNIRRKST
jgi:hypothetical protein